MAVFGAVDLCMVTDSEALLGFALSVTGMCAAWARIYRACIFRSTCWARSGGGDRAGTRHTCFIDTQSRKAKLLLREYGNRRYMRPIRSPCFFFVCLTKSKMSMREKCETVCSKWRHPMDD